MTEENNIYITNKRRSGSGSSSILHVFISSYFTMGPRRRLDSLLPRVPGTAPTPLSRPAVGLNPQQPE